MLNSHGVRSWVVYSWKHSIFCCFLKFIKSVVVLIVLSFIQRRSGRSREWRWGVRGGGPDRICSQASVVEQGVWEQLWPNCWEVFCGHAAHDGRGDWMVRPGGSNSLTFHTMVPFHCLWCNITTQYSRNDLSVSILCRYISKIAICYICMKALSNHPHLIIHPPSCPV